MENEKVLTRRVRAWLRLTQTEMAQLMGVHPQTVSKWEREEIVPSAWQSYMLMLIERVPPQIACDAKASIVFRGPARTFAWLMQNGESIR